MNLTSTKFFSLREEQKLFNTMLKSSDKAALVDRMLYQLLSLSGLRISEALALKWSDIGEDYILVRGKTTTKIIPTVDGEYLVKRRKATKSGRSRETVHIGNKLIKLLAEYKALNLFPHSEYLFNTQKGPYKRTNAHDRLKYWLKVAGLRTNLSCHSFRHSYATKCLDAGLPLTLVRDQMRHGSLTVTSVYLHFSQESKDKLKEVM